MKEIQINMVLSNCENETEETIWNKFIEWVEANGWTVGGSIRLLEDEDVTLKIVRGTTKK